MQISSNQYQSFRVNSWFRPLRFYLVTSITTGQFMFCMSIDVLFFRRGGIVINEVGMPLHIDNQRIGALARYRRYGHRTGS